MVRKRRSGFVPDFSRPQKMTFEFHQRFECQPRSVKKPVQSPTSFIVGILYYVLCNELSCNRLFTSTENEIRISSWGKITVFYGREKSGTKPLII